MESVRWIWESVPEGLKRFISLHGERKLKFTDPDGTGEGFGEGGFIVVWCQDRTPVRRRLD